MSGPMRRMPFGFGAAPGPRQRIDGGRHDWTDSPNRRSVFISFLTDRARLAALMPPGFELEGEPVVTIEFGFITNLAWLAGRGYNVLGVRWPARYRGDRDDVSGSFLAVLWENRADPIITGREELGWSKLWCDLPEPRVFSGRHNMAACWDNFQFVDAHVENLVSVAPTQYSLPGHVVASAGTLHYKYIPQTGVWGDADVAYACLSPPADATTKVVGSWRATGEVRFVAATWEELPTLHHIVGPLAALPQIEDRGAFVVQTIGGSDLGNQRALR